MIWTLTDALYLWVDSILLSFDERKVVIFQFHVCGCRDMRHHGCSHLLYIIERVAIQPDVDVFLDLILQFLQHALWCAQDLLIEDAVTVELQQQFSTLSD